MAYPVFKGATRPVMVLGVPQVPMFFAVAVVVAFSVFVNMPPLAVPLAAIEIFIMRGMARRDDYIFRQMYLNFVMNKAKNFNSRIWGKGVYSFSPTQYRKYSQNMRVK